MAVLLSHLGMMAQTIDLEITSPGINKIDIYLTPSSNVTLGEVTFTIKRLTACAAIIGAPIVRDLSSLVFTKVNMATDALNTYESFAAVPTTFPMVTALERKKIVSFNLTGTGTCTFGIENDNALLTTLLLLNGTLNVTDNLGTTLTVNIINNAIDVVLLAELLPVELSSFTAEKKDATTRLKWETVSEKDLFGYVIERSSDGKNFQDIGYVEAKAKSLTEKVTYEDIDNKPESGINYYRLRTKEKVKNVTYSKIVSVDFGGGVKTKTYPNPFSSELSIEIDIEHKISGDVLIDLFDTAGKLIYTNKVVMEGKKLIFNLPTLNLTPGNYIVRIKNGKDTWQQKITKS